MPAHHSMSRARCWTAAVVGAWVSSHLGKVCAYRPSGESPLLLNAGTSCYPSKAYRASQNDARSTSGSDKVLVVMPRADGFNNQRIAFFEGVAAAFQHNAKVVLPPVLDNIGNYHPGGNGAFDWGHFFDVEHIAASGLEVALPKDVTQLCSEGVVMVSPHLAGTAGDMMMQVYRHQFGVNMSTTSEEAPGDRCVTRLPKVDMGTEYSDYCTHGQGYTLSGAKEGSAFAKAWRAIIPSASLRETAQQVLNVMPARFNAVQLRRGDYKDHCHKNYAADLAGCYPTGDQVLARIDELLDSNLPIWVMTNDPEWAKEVLGDKMFDAAELFADAELEPNWWGDSTDQVMLLEQMIAANAENFIGNRYSSVSNTVRNMRWECNSGELPMFWSDQCGAKK